MKTQPNRLKKQADDAGVAVIELVKEAIVREGSKEAAARSLGVSRNTVDYHLKKAGIEPAVQQSVTFISAEAH